MITSYLSETQSVDIEIDRNRILFKVRDNKSNTVMFAVPIDKAEHFMNAFNAEYQMAVEPKEEKEGDVNGDSI